ncbi:MAG TPA: hypothetical protein VF177_19245 [Anaerolineae bacterium]
MKTFVALFDNVSHAGQTAQNLDSVGVDRDDIHLIVRQAEPTYESLLEEALGDAELTEEEVAIYRQRVDQGGALLVVHVDDDLAAEARAIMDRYGLIDLEGESLSEREADEMDATLAEAAEDKPEVEAETWATYESSFHNHHQTNYAPSGYSYELYEPAYLYGYQLAMDRNNAGRSWEEIEPEAQRYWEARRRGEWSQFKDAVRHAWEEVRDTIDWREIDEEVESTKRGQQYRHLKEDRW